MSSIGPQLPPHLTKRKRTPDADGETNSPPSKRVPTNQEEIALDDEPSEDEYGPSMPKASIGPSLPPTTNNTTATTDPSIGPSIGPTFPASNSNEIPLDNSESDSDTGPARALSPQLTQVVPPPRRVLGPAPPPGALSERPDSDGDSDSDDDYGPSLPTSNTHLTRQSQALEAAALEAANGPKPPQRDDWMLAPPTAGGPRAADPTKIKARKFNSGPRASADNSGGGAAGEISSIWTETPEQKRQRLKNAVLGRGSGSGNGGAGSQTGSSNDRRSKEEEAKAEQIRANLEAARGPSLYAEHQRREGGKGGRIEAEEDDPSKRGFDWEKDMKSGSKIGTAQRKELMNKAADFGGRFSKGKYL